METQRTAPASQRQVLPIPDRACLAALVVACLLMTQSTARACSVPVFRYALEYWTTDPYVLLVYHDGELSTEDQAQVDRLKRASEEEPFANVLVRCIDLSKRDAEAKPGAEEPTFPQLPWVVLRYPIVSQIREPAWSGALSNKNVDELLDSPLRAKIANLIVSGKTAVWLLLESGDRQKDEAAEKTLKTVLKEVEKECKLNPPFYEDYFGAEDEQPAAAISFVVIRLPRKAVAEQMLINMLMHSEPDLTDYADPIVFPVFGRGRALFALVGKGINRANLFEACAFLVGPCMCQVKAAAPGTELLMAVNWDKLLFEGVEAVEVTAAKPAKPIARPQVVARPRQSAEGGLGQSLRRTLALVIVGVFVAVSVGFLFLLRNKK